MPFNPKWPALIVPRNVDPVGECVLCEEVFYTQRDAARHFERNAERHLELAREAAGQLDLRPIEERIPILAPWDPEVAAHMRKVGERMVREGRLTVKKSERAGF
jgi:hypothetical protein